MKFIQKFRSMLSNLIFCFVFFSCLQLLISVFRWSCISFDLLHCTWVTLVCSGFGWQIHNSYTATQLLICHQQQYTVDFSLYCEILLSAVMHNNIQFPCHCYFNLLSFNVLLPNKLVFFPLFQKFDTPCFGFGCQEHLSLFPEDLSCFLKYASLHAIKSFQHFFFISYTVQVTKQSRLNSC